MKSGSENLQLLRFESAGGSYGLTFGSSDPPSGFQRYRLVAEFPPGNGPGTAKLLSGEVEIVSGQIGSDEFDLGMDTIRFGIVYAEGNTGGSVWFDDLRCGTNFVGG